QSASGFVAENAKPCSWSPFNLEMNKAEASMSSETAPATTPHFEENGPPGPVPPPPRPNVDAPISEDDDFVEVLEEEEMQPKRNDSGRHREMLAICCFA